MNNAWIGTWAAAAVLALATSGCMGPSGPDDLPPAVSADRAAAEPADSELQIVAFGPRGLRAGEDFYPQANGEAAMWVEVNRPLDGMDASIWLAGNRLQRTVLRGRVVTGTLPASLALHAGVHQLQVRVVLNPSRPAVTASADFPVEPGYEHSSDR